MQVRLKTAQTAHKSSLLRLDGADAGDGIEQKQDHKDPACVRGELLQEKQQRLDEMAVVAQG